MFGRLHEQMILTRITFAMTKLFNREKVVNYIPFDVEGFVMKC